MAATFTSLIIFILFSYLRDNISSRKWTTWDENAGRFIVSYFLLFRWIFLAKLRRRACSHLIDDSIKYFKTKRVILVKNNVTERKERIYFWKDDNSNKTGDAKDRLRSKFHSHITCTLSLGCIKTKWSWNLEEKIESRNKLKNTKTSHFSFQK